MTERDYLREESQSAKEGMKDSCRQIGRSMAATATQAWRKHPMLVGAAVAGIAGLSVVWLVRSRQPKRAFITEVEPARGPSIFARAGGLIGKMLFSYILAKLTTPPADAVCDSAGDSSVADATI